MADGETGETAPLLGGRKRTLSSRSLQSVERFHRRTLSTRQDSNIGGGER